MRAPIPENETERLAELRSYEILDTGPESAYDDITTIASEICGVPIALVSMVDGDRQWFKSSLGLGVPETPRDLAFCAHAILQPDLFVVPDALTDERFANNPLVTSDPMIRFYAGAPLITSGGFEIGTLCVIDRKPRELDSSQRQSLLALSRQVVAQLELRRELRIRKQVEVALRESEDRYKQLVEHASDVIYRTDVEGNLTFVNPPAAALMRCPVEDLLGRHFLELIRPDARAEAAAFYRKQFLDAGSNTYFEFPAVAGDGETVWFGQKVQPVVKGTRVVGFQAVARDISDLKRMREELQRSRDIAVESSRMKSSFLANMSHEIRTPMNGIIGMTGLLLDSSLTAEQKETAETVRSSAHALLSIINDILDFSKIEAGMLTFEMMDFSLITTMEECVGLLSDTAGAKGIELRTLTDAGVPVALVGDPGRLRQILINLVGNAVKFTERGEVSIRASCLEENETGAVIRIEVRDSGIGISPAAQKTLFDPFTQEDSSTSRRYGGTGLGLAISKQLVDRMGGEIGVDSVPGEGSTFWFTVRLEKKRSRVGDVASAVAQSDSAPSLKRLGDGIVPETVPRSLRILIAEDNIVNQKVALRQLKKLGYEADAVSNGLEALRAIESTPYDLVLMDCQMPEMDGYTATETLRGREQEGTRIPVIAMTANAFESNRKRCLQSGMDDYISKPVDVEILRELLAKWLMRG